MTYVVRTPILVQLRPGLEKSRCWHRGILVEATHASGMVGAFRIALGFAIRICMNVGPNMYFDVLDFPMPF